MRNFAWKFKERWNVSSRCENVNNEAVRAADVKDDFLKAGLAEVSTPWDWADRSCSRSHFFHRKNAVGGHDQSREIKYLFIVAQIPLSLSCTLHLSGCTFISKSFMNKISLPLECQKKKIWKLEPSGTVCALPQEYKTKSNFTFHKVNCLNSAHFHRGN